MSAAWQVGLNEALASANQAVRDVVSRRSGQSTDQLAGFVAEHWHAATFNVDAYKKGVWDLIATVPESNTRASFDVVVERNGETLLTAQSKYYKTAQDTAKQLWNPDYNNTGAKIVPVDQVRDVIDESRKRAIVEGYSRPDVSRASGHTVEHASDRLRVEGAESRPLGRQEANQVTDRARSGADVMSMADTLSAGEIAKNAAIGGAVAAGIGFALGAAPKLIEAVSAWRKGAGIGDDEFLTLLADAGRDGALAGAWAGLQGAVSTTLVHLASTGVLGEVLKGVGPGPIGAISVCVIQSIRDGLACWRGEINTTQLAQRCVTTGVVSAGGIAGGAAGQLLIPVPVLGALIGSVVGSILARAGVSVAFWTIDHILPYFDAAVTGLGNAAFGWDVLIRARQQSAEFNDLLAQAEASGGELREFEFEMFRALRLPQIDEHAIRSRARDQLARLAALETMQDE